jgi:hypothetical protein
MARERSVEALATSYRLAADSLVGVALSSGTAYEYTYPTLYLYRHSLELYLKAILKPAILNHDLEVLSQDFVHFVRAQYGVVVPAWFKNSLQDFASFDPDSDAFRYASTRREGYTPGSPMGSETWVDLPRLRARMEAIVRAFERILRYR